MAPRGPNDEEGVIDPQDLDITNNEKVHEIDDGQYVISTGDGTLEGIDVNELRDGVREQDASSTTGQPESKSTSEHDPRAAILEYMASSSTTQGIVAVGRFDGAVRAHESASDDLGSVFHNLLTWYATSIDADTSPEEVLGILCLAGDVQVRYPVRTLVDLLAVYDLSPDDSIRELIHAVQEDGFALPPDDDTS